MTKPVENKSSELVIATVEQNFIAKFVVPEAIITDQGGELTSVKFNAFCSLLGISHRINKRLSSTSERCDRESPSYIEI